MASGDEAPQVHLDQVGHPDVVGDDVPDVGHLLALTEEADRRQPERLLVALGGMRGERADHHAAHVHHVSRYADPGHQLAVEEDGLLDHDVLGVQAAAVVRVVGEEHVPGTGIVAVPGDGRSDGVGRRPEVEQDHPGPHDQAALGVHEGDRVVLGLGHGGRDRRVLDRQAGLLADGFEPGPDHLQFDGIIDRVPARMLMLRPPSAGFRACR